jgi:hypothetical protein
MLTSVRFKSAEWIFLAVFLLVPTAGFSQQQGEVGESEAQQEPAQLEELKAQTEEDDGGREEEAKLTSVPGGQALGMSILGNQEAPTSLVIVPWKSSEIGDSVGISTMLDDSRQPVDQEVFMRALLYYEIRSETKP